MNFWTLESLTRMSVMLSGGLIAGALLRRRPAALRHWVLAVSIAAAWAAPLLPAALPRALTPAIWRTLSPGRIAAAPGRTVDTVAADARFASTRTIPLATTTGDARARFRTVRALRNAAFAFWLTATSVGALLLAMALLRLRRMRLRAEPITAGAWFDACERLRTRHAHADRIALLQSDHPSRLVTWGWRRPKILLPSSACDWPADRIDIVLTHELAHVARRDWLWTLAVESLRVVYPFNPLIWIAARRLRNESERACDDAVLRSGVDASEYASQLLALVRLLHDDRQQWLPAPAMARPSSLEGRVRAMLDSSLNRHPVSRRTRAVTLGLALALTLTVAAAGAQTTFYSFTGTVLDPSSRVIPNVTLVLTDASNTAKHEVKSNAAGAFTFVGLPENTYTLVVSAPGFSTFKLDSVQETGDVDRTLTLKVGSLEETITVTDGSTVTPPPDAATLQRREESRRRFAERMEQEKVRCAAGGAVSTVGGKLFPPTKQIDARPEYPQELQDAKIAGTVTMIATIGTDGLVRDIQNVQGPHPALEIAATDAVRQWQFSPTLLNCEPIDVAMKVTINFAASHN